MKGLSPDRLERFCTRKNGRYEFVNEVRGLIVFAPQDLLADPPFSSLDLVTCRNLLIYLDRAVQKKIIQLFHFALRDGGYIFLGSAETTCGQDNLFEPVSQKWRIYRKLGAATPIGLDLPIRGQHKRSVVLPAVQRPRPTLAAMTHQALAERYSPAAAVVDRKGSLLYTHGNIRDFLEIPLGETTSLLADAVREGLRNRLAAAVTQAVAENKRILVQARITTDRKKSIPVKLTVAPLRSPREAEGLLLVTFEALASIKTRRTAAASAAPPSDVHELEDELKVTREELQSTIEQLEQSNENLKASNEEATASNEELQSANEELETSKEELQSLNEELNAVNERLQEKVIELEQASNDVSNLLTSGGIATVFLDRELKVRRFTRAVTKLLNLVETDIGRPVADIHRKFRDENLLSDARRVLVDLAPISAEVESEDGSCYQRRILPYRTLDDRIEGVVITFHDVSELKELMDALRISEDAVRRHADQVQINEARLQALMNAVPVGVSFSDSTSCEHISGNPAALDQFEVTSQDNLSASATNAAAAGRRVRYLLKGRELRDTELPMQRAVSEGGVIPPMELEIVLPSGRRWFAETSGAPIHDTHGNIVGGVAVTADITERKRIEQAFRENEARLESLAENLPSVLMRYDRQHRVVYLSPQAEAITGVSIDQFLGRNRKAGMPEQLCTLWDDAIEHVFRTGENRDLEFDFPGQQGARTFYLRLAPEKAANGSFTHVLGISTDITARKQAEDALRRTAAELSRSNEDLEQFARAASHDLQEPLRMVSGFLKLLRERYEPQLDDKAREYIGYAVEGSTRMSQLITDLLDYSRIERQGSEPQPTRAADALAGALFNLRAGMEEAGATVTHTELPSVNADPAQFTRLFQNLVGNAVKFRSQERPCRIEIAARPAGPQWLFSVTDNGIGIPPAAFDRVFVIFQRLHTRQRYPGTGIGLAICKKIVERHGGRIWVESTLGQGSTFYFTWPGAGGPAVGGDTIGEQHG
jgi:two-component system CheB/CheR fusion protein